LIIVKIDFFEGVRISSDSHSLGQLLFGVLAL
jgi:hypothetical protein